MPKSLDQANKISSLFNSVTKIVILFGTAVSSCTFAYYLILENQKDVVIEKQNRVEAIALVKAEYTRQISLLEERGDKRYNRAMGLGTELKSWGMKLEERIRELEKENAELKGKYNATH